MERKRFGGWTGLFSILALFLAFGYAYGQDYPTKPIEVIVGYPPGGGTDLIARAVADAPPKYVGQPLVVINKGGYRNDCRAVCRFRESGRLHASRGRRQRNESPSPISRACPTTPSTTSFPSFGL